MARDHFSNLYKDPRTSNIEDQLKSVRLFPSYLTTEDGLSLNNPIS